ncbi:GTP-binding protein [bacterium]|nr:MAG: GTP-binding protein [bacterium]
MAQGRRPAQAPLTGDVVVALATPPGAGALAVVRLSGPGAWAAAASFVAADRPPAPRRATLLALRDGDAVLDQAVVTRFEAGASYSGEETVELSTHGSPYVVERVLALAEAAGCRPARPGEFTYRAYLNGRLDLPQAEAVCDLIAARSADEHRTAAADLEGGLSSRVEALRAGALDLAALVEANLDHPDDDLPPVRPEDAARRAGALADAAASLAASRRRARLGAGAPSVVLLGAPNAGKSSLLNALLGEDRALVSPEPGTTRDAVEAVADLAGAACALVDTAGVRAAPASELERRGAEVALSRARAADLTLLVVDRAGDPAEARAAAAHARTLSAEGRCAAVLTKCDLPERVAPEDLAGLETVSVSARTGLGLDALAALARRRLAALPRGLPAAGRQAAALLDAAAAFSTAAAELAAGREETAAHTLRAGLAALDSLVGKDTSEEVLGAVFARFCVGK